MGDFFNYLNANAGALTLLFSGIVTVATAVYAVLTWVLVKETKMMREVQTEPRLQVTVSSFDVAVHIVRLHVRNIGLGPALDVTFTPRVISGGTAAEGLLAEFTNMNFFSVGLKYFGPGQEQVSRYTQLTENYEGKMNSVLALDVTYRSSTGKKYKESLVVDMSELKGGYQLGKPHIYAIAQNLEKIQTDIHHLVTGFRRIKTDVYTSGDRAREAAEAEAQRERWRREHESQQELIDGPPNDLDA